MKRCFFIGHRDAPESIYPELYAAVERHIKEYGVTEFMVGRYGMFDRMALRAVAEAKIKYPFVKLTMLLAYLPAEGIFEKPAAVDELYYPQGLETTPRRYAIVRANRYAVGMCGFVIAYVWQAASNARKLLEYAQGRTQMTILSGEK